MTHGTGHDVEILFGWNNVRILFLRYVFEGLHIESDGPTDQDISTLVIT